MADIIGFVPLSTRKLYLPLSNNPQQIRLLILLPGVGQQPLEISLEVVSLDDKKEYETLSYEALGVLRSSTEPRTLWVDAICINQEDLEERSSQVRLMGQIYGQSKRTIVWLGKASEHTSQTFAFLKSLDTNRFGTDQELNARYKKLISRLQNNAEDWRIVQHGYWGDIAQRAFWKRTWIVQEVVLSGVVTIFCGSNEIEWTKFADAAWKLVDATQGVSQSFWDSIPGLTHLTWIDEIKKACATRHQMRVADLVVALRGFKASKPLDKAYGVLGLINSTNFGVGYRKTVAEVYTDLAKWSIMEEQLLDIICMKRDSATVNPLPSWVPDWRYAEMSLPRHPLCLKWVAGDQLRKFMAPRTHEAVSADGTTGYAEGWNTHGTTKADWSISHAPLSKLTVAGRLIGMIDRLGGYYPIPGNDRGPPFYQTFLNWEAVALSKFGNRKSTSFSKHLTQVFDQCLIIWNETRARGLEQRIMRPTPLDFEVRNETLGPYVECDSNANQNACVVEAFVRTITGGRDNNWRIMSPEKYTNFWSPEREAHENWILELEALQVPFHRRFMTLAEGQMGLSAPEAEIGDIVAVLYGCSIPVILRRLSDGRTTLVGECLVQGLMEGAAIEERNRERFPEVVWEIS